MDDNFADVGTAAPDDRALVESQQTASEPDGRDHPGSDGEHLLRVPWPVGAGELLGDMT